jgi:transposase
VDVFADEMQQLSERLAAVEMALWTLIDQKMVKESYTTAEVAKILSRSEFTVREWCRLGRVHASKRACGRGPTKEWSVSHTELLRIQNEGLLALQHS